jgi:hypothetical protein
MYYEEHINFVALVVPWSGCHGTRLMGLPTEVSKKYKMFGMLLMSQMELILAGTCNMKLLTLPLDVCIMKNMSTL